MNEDYCFNNTEDIHTIIQTNTSTHRIKANYSLFFFCSA